MTPTQQRDILFKTLKFIYRWSRRNDGKKVIGGRGKTPSKKALKRLA